MNQQHKNAAIQAEKGVNQWVQEITNNDTGRAIASAVNVPHRTFARYLASDYMPFNVMVDICRAYDADPITALVRFGLITSDEFRAAAQDYAAEQAGLTALAENLAKRINGLQELARRAEKEQSPRAMELVAVALINELKGIPQSSA